MSAVSASVRYDAACTLVFLSSHVSAIKAAATCFCEIAFKEADNNVKLIVLDKFNELRLKNEKTLDEYVMQVLRIISSPDLKVRSKCLSIAIDMVDGIQVDEVINFLKKELLKTHQQTFEKVFETN